MSSTTSKENAGNEVNESEGSGIDTVNTLIESMNAKPIDKAKDEKIERRPPPKIQKVPFVVGDDEKLKKHYKPKWISIGPIHHGNENLQFAEKKKLNWTAKFVQTCRYRACEILYDRIEDDIKTLMRRFDEEVIHDFIQKGHPDGDHEKALAWMLFVDGCFILHFIDSLVNNCKSDISDFKNDQIAFVLQDLFLLENQIPFEVLQILIDNSRRKQQLTDYIRLFLRINAMAPPKYENSLDFDMNAILAKQPVHLLDLLRIALLHKPSPESKEQPGKRTVVNSTCLFNFIPNLLQRLKDKFRTCAQLPVKKEPNQNQNDRNDEQQFFRSISDLKAAGIDLKPSKIRGLKDSVKFSIGIFTAELELPPVKVDDSTEPKFLNMIAFEMCPDNFKTEYEITSYISFLDSLIDYPNDVKELRRAHILHNFLGCDEEVAKVFNKIGRFLVPNSEVYREVKAQIERHYQNRCMTWIAQVINDHFSTPWTIVAFLAGFLALALTVIQTWYTIDPPGGP